MLIKQYKAKYDSKHQFAQIPPKFNSLIFSFKDISQVNLIMKTNLMLFIIIG